MMSVGYELNVPMNEVHKDLYANLRAAQALHESLKHVTMHTWSSRTSVVDTA